MIVNTRSKVGHTAFKRACCYAVWFISEGSDRYCCCSRRADGTYLEAATVYSTDSRGTAAIIIVSKLHLDVLHLSGR